MAQLSGPDARFRSRRLSTAALQLITATTRSATKRDPTTREDRSAQSGRSDGAAGPRVEDTPGAADDKHSQDAWAELVEAEIADAPGALSPPWAALFDEASRGEIALRLVTRSGQAGMSSTVTITPGAALSISERRRLRVTETEIEVEAVEDAVELAVFDPGSLWPAVQRLLPPSPAVRADGSRRSALTERTVGIVQDRRGAGAPPRVEMPEAVLAELAASDVEVSLTMHVDRGPQAPAAVTQRHWAAQRDGGLLEIRVADGAISVVDVPAGTIADELIWLVTGAIDLRARAGRAAS